MTALQAIATILLLISPADEKVGRDRTVSTDLPGAADHWADLGSRFYVLRRKAELRLIHLGPADAVAVVRVLLGSPDPTFRRAAVRWLHGRFEARLGTDADRRLLVEALLSERDPSVLASLMSAAAQDGELVARVRKQVALGQVPVRFLGALFEARLKVLLEQVMHEGRVPGFFDGQFVALLAVDDSAYWRVLRMAWDPRLHFVIRSLSIMALHEARHKDLERQLSPLLTEVARESGQMARAQLWLQVDAYSVRAFLRARLSQYARFSMAKAGVAGPINKKIEYLKKLASTNLREAEKLLRQGNPYQHQILLDRAMSYFFELGYHYQQLDEYLKAELQYRVITEQEEPVSSRRMAHYNLACIRAIQGRKEEALVELRHAVRAGFKDSSWALRDGDLEPLRDDERFHKILTELDGDS